MKKLIILVIQVILPVTFSYGQTDSIEKAALYKRLLSGEIQNNAFSDGAQRWRKFISDFGGYPDLPVDENGKVHFVSSRRFEGMNTDILFSRAAEWIAINYSIMPGDIYANRHDGKIIFTNSLSTPTGYDCTFTNIITIKGELLYFEFINLGFYRYFAGHTSIDGEWVPENSVRMGIDEVCPVILRKTSEWKFNLELLKASKEIINREIINLHDYIILYDHIY